MFLEVSNTISKIYNLSQTRKDYCIIPHCGTTGCEFIFKNEESFALCSCLLGPLYWGQIYHEALESLSQTSIERLSFLLLLAPNFQTLWNQRKRLIRSGALSLDEDLVFNRLVLTAYPRSTESLLHRSWTLQELSDTFFESRLEEELDFTEFICDKYPCHFMGWQHRRWLVRKRGFSLALYQSEWEKMQEWNLGHPMDASGWSYREFLLLWCQQFHDVPVDTLIAEVKNTIYETSKDPENDVLWGYRKQVVMMLAGKLADPNQLKEVDPLIRLDNRLRDLPEKSVKLLKIDSMPKEYERSWASLLYKRYLRWLAQNLGEKLSGL